MSHRQIRFLDGHHLLFVLGGINDVQSVCLPVGDDLEHGSGSVVLLHGQDASPRPLELFKIGQEQKSPLGVNGIDQVPKGALGNRGDQVGVQDLVGGTVGVVAFYQSDPVVFPGHLNELEQVVNAVVVSTFWGFKSYGISLKCAFSIAGVY